MSGTTPDDVRFISRNPTPGLGCWLWKPLLVHYLVHQANQGERILYLDAGFELNLRSPGSRARLNSYWEVARQQGVAAFDSGFSTRAYTKAAVVKEFNLENLLDAQQVASGALFLVAGSASREFADSWLTSARRNDYSLIDNSISQHEDISFVETRWEQALMSATYLTRGLVALPMEVHFGEGFWHWRREGAEYPLWASRNSRGIPRYAWPPVLAPVGVARRSAEKAWARTFKKSMRD